MSKFKATSRFIFSGIFVIGLCACGGGGGGGGGPTPDNQPPTANAGGDQTVDANTIVILDGSSSNDSDGDIANYSWRQISGFEMTLNNSGSAQSDFISPANNGTLVFELTVTDDAGDSDTDTVSVTVENGVALVPGLAVRPDNMNCIAPDSPGTAPDSLDLVDVFTNWNMPSFPMGLFQLPNNDNYFFVTTRDGRVLRFDNDPGFVAPIEVLDISSQVNDDGEGGLLGFAFHPGVATNGAVYMYYTESGSPLRSVISRFTISSDFSTIDPGSEVQILTVDQPFSNHNGGSIAFGPDDGFLYIAFGDGGDANDPQGHGQNTNTLLGAMLRIDVDPTTTSEPFYSIPNGNPFASGGISPGGGLEEIYAWGLRNPFRWSFDTGTGDLWLADVGQNAREEIDLIVNGGNYGWSDMEGNSCRVGDCSAFVAPIHDYPRTVGRSITGGFVYRGMEIPGLNGTYIFGDYSAGNIFTLTANGSSYDRATVASPASGSIVSFAQDNTGEVYVMVALANNNRTILKLQAPSGAPSGSNIPPLLSQTGCFENGNPMQADAGLIPYDVISPLWSDGAEKERWIALPNDGTVDLLDDGDFDFPVGTVLVKNFSNNAVMIETRLLMHHASGWAGYSYKWRDDQSDAELLSGADDDTVLNSLLNWHFPSGAECRQCHTPVKNFALGPEILQLNHDFFYPQTNQTANQLFTFYEIDMFSPSTHLVLGNDTLFALDDNNATPEQRIKSYLHSNCSQCHQPGGTGGGAMDLRFQTSLAQMNICDVVPQGGSGVSNPNFRYIAPGNPEDSVILIRMESLDGNIRMPPLATSIVDTEAVAVITNWISSLSSCP